MNSTTLIPSVTAVASQRVEFFRLSAPGKRDPHFGISRGWCYKAAALGEIKLVAIRQRGALRGVRLIAYDSVMDYIRRSMGNATATGEQQMDCGLIHVIPATIAAQSRNDGFRSLRLQQSKLDQVDA